MPSGDAPVLDLRCIALPSDVLTLGRVRAIEPKLHRGRAILLGESHAAAAVNHELEIAHHAFRAALGDPPAIQWSRADNVEVLDEVYRQYGLSTGLHATEELVKEIERQAATQARARFGHPR